MGRPRGSRNSDYDDKRQVLARKVAATLTAAPAEHVSLRELAREAEVSVSTMRHYFGDRNGLVAAALEELGQEVASHLRQQADRLSGTVHERLVAFLTAYERTWCDHGLGRAHAVGLAEGLYSGTGPLYRQHLIDPLHEVTVRVLQRIHDEGLAHIDDVEGAALALLSPLLVSLTREQSLQGPCGASIDITGFVATQIPAFERGWLHPAA